MRSRFFALRLGFVWLMVFGGTSSQGLAQELQIDGKWATRLGVMKIVQDGKKVVGQLIWVSSSCPFKRGDEVLKGVLLEDSLSGQWKYCLKGKECTPDQWAPVVMLVTRAGKVLSGAAHYGKTECKIGGKGAGDGMVFRKLKPTPLVKKHPITQKDPENPVIGSQTQVPAKEPDLTAPLADEQGQPLEEEVKPLDQKQFEKNQGSWRSNMEEAKSFLEGGFFERARKKFFKATELDPSKPEAFNGIGVTYYARGDYEEALNWYKKALEVEPDFGDAYYNTACIYAILKKNEMAFRYLSIAVLNGFVDYQAMEQDPDLQNLRVDPNYKEILKLMKEKSQ